MAETTEEKVLAIASHLKDLDSTTIQMYIDDANDELSGTVLAGNERVERYLAAHFGTLNVRRAERESVENISVSYNTLDGEGLERTEYGQEVKRLFNKEAGPTFRLFS